MKIMSRARVPCAELWFARNPSVRRTVNPDDHPLHPPIEPGSSGWLAVGEGHEIYWEQCGRDDGMPVLFLHGGPGSGCSPDHRRFFDPAHYRAVLLDQRGCGRSRPPGRLEGNTTGHLVEDLERLREHLGIARWIVFGGSWGSTLALAYARRHPLRVRALVLRGVFLARRREVESFAYNLRALLPEAWHALAAPFGVVDEQAARDFDLATHCARTVLHGAAEAAGQTARAWLTLESQAMGLTDPGPRPALASAPLNPRTFVYMHYLAERFFLRDGELLEGLEVLDGTPVHIVQGALDPVCPPITAWELSTRLPQARLQVIPGSGHGAFEPGLRRALVAAMDGLRVLPA